jgi:RES domain-containing protein
MASLSDATMAWRIVKRRYASAAFDGEGARRFGGRWNSPGTAVVYVSESRALALLEVLAGLRSVTPLPAYAMISATFDEALVRAIDPRALPSEWRNGLPHPSIQQIGDEWAARLESAVLRVPSVLVPQEYNYLLNPKHPAFSRITIGQPEDVTIDPRLVR